MLKPIEGSFDQCFSHYRRYGNDESFAKLGRLINVKSQSPRRWFTGAIRPVGEYKIRVGQALTDMGYSIREIRDMHPVLQDCHALIAYGHLGIDDAVAGFMMTTPSARDMLLSSLLGKHGMSNERLAHGERFIAPLRTKLPAAHARVTPEPTVPQPKSAAVTDVQSAQLSAPPPSEPIKDHDAVAAALAAMLLSSYPLLQFVNSDNFTPEERKKLRERLGFFGAMNISTELNRLCSEKARTQFEGTTK